MSPITVYDLHIEDPALANAFFANFLAIIDSRFDQSTQIGKKNIEVNDDLGSVDGQGYSPFESHPNIAGSLALAYILDTYNTGVKILKQGTDGSFKELHTIMENTNGKNIFKPYQCKYVNI